MALYWWSLWIHFFLLVATHGLLLGISDLGISLSCPTEIKSMPTWHSSLAKHQIYEFCCSVTMGGKSFTPGLAETPRGLCCQGWLLSRNMSTWPAKLKKIPLRLHSGLPCSTAFCVHVSGSWIKREHVLPWSLHRADDRCLHLAVMIPLIQCCCYVVSFHCNGL